jgi:hypothetical protein
MKKIIILISILTLGLLSFGQSEMINLSINATLDESSVRAIINSSSDTIDNNMPVANLEESSDPSKTIVWNDLTLRAEYTPLVDASYSLTIPFFKCDSLVVGNAVFRTYSTGDIVDSVSVYNYVSKLFLKKLYP